MGDLFCKLEQRAIRRDPAIMVYSYVVVVVVVLKCDRSNFVTNALRTKVTVFGEQWTRIQRTEARVESCTRNVIYREKCICPQSTVDLIEVCMQSHCH